MGNALSSVSTLPIAWHLVSPSAWFAIEAIAAYHYTPFYSYAANFVSDLGVPYPHINPVQNDRIAFSPNAWLMNAINFKISAFGFGLGPFLLYRRARLRGEIASNTAQKERLWKWRIICGLSYIVGSILVGSFHAGPREKENGMETLHAVGAVLAIGPANIHSILAGYMALLDKPSATRVKLAHLEIVMGVVGFVSGLLIGLAPQSHTGTVERISISSYQLWMYIKAGELALAEYAARSGDQN